MNDFEFLRRLVEALGLQGKGVQRVVIEAGVRQRAKVYVQMVAGHDRMPAVCELFELVKVADVTVSDYCTVAVTPE